MYFRLMGKLNARRKGLLEEGEKGFTLIELLVVVIIIGILAAIAIPVYLGIQDGAKDAAVKSDLTNGKTALIGWLNDNAGKTYTDASTAIYATTTSLATNGAKYGATFSDNTTSITFSVPTAGGYAFCLVGVSKSSGSQAFNITDITGTKKGSTCGTNS